MGDSYCMIRWFFLSIFWCKTAHSSAQETHRWWHKLQALMACAPAFYVLRVYQCHSQRAAIADETVFSFQTQIRFVHRATRKWGNVAFMIVTDQQLAYSPEQWMNNEINKTDVFKSINLSNWLIGEMESSWGLTFSALRHYVNWSQSNCCHWDAV